MNVGKPLQRVSRKTLFRFLGAGAFVWLAYRFRRQFGFQEGNPMKTQTILQQIPLQFQWPTADPFLFCVHHEDFYPEGNGKFGPKASLAGRDIGQDFAGKDGWRMYHGDKIPGFPGHPHRGFETVTVVERGLVDHADSQGAAGRYGNGDVQWMTAGSGLQHSEMFPLLNEDKENTLELFQIWLNLPAKNKMVEPHFKMLWKEEIPVQTKLDGSGNRIQIKSVAGTLFGDKPVPPPPNSWAADPANEVGIYIILLEKGAKLLLPAQKPGIRRNLYFYRGSGLSIGGESVATKHMFVLNAEETVELEAGGEEIRILLLEGRPIAEPVVQYGPFVMNTEAEIQQAFNDYRRTQFGGWPWSSYDPVHTGKGRFARHANGNEETPT